ncbi:tyrosine-type recombinase/integrase [Deinococcus xianganensis]|uniref:Tyrosine-type recombinase/integrase n=1 Tax=Deinococcus xianganensis TaxID=1507289 RepID=A0A6I4YP34_9DEIO|nr:tyrosine-type recombinase/integrase [Deinococcus xianganensis]MXV20777.1 tyrosine-type recombinase/integrase [Deinococcus xianganensis]
MSFALVQHNLELQARADRLAALDPEALRREAVRAARDADPEGLWGLVEAFLVTTGRRGARVSDHTLSSYRIGLQVFLDWAGPAGVSLLRPGARDGYRFARHLEALKLAPSSVRARLAAGRALYGALRWSGATESAPFTDVRTAPDPTPRHEKRKPYTDADLAAMLLVAGPQETVIVLLGAHCGLRNAEMRGLAWGDVHLESGAPFINVLGKRGRRQDVALSRSAAAALRVWRGMRGAVKPSDPVLLIRSSRNLGRAVERVCRAAGVTYEGREVHGLRHSAGTKVYAATNDLLAVRDTLRHRTIDSSEIYVDYARAQQPKVNADW